ncbi:DNA polymerase I [Burkholderia ambifaria AMMD]|uniref:DNA polymerase I n=1 Tax=Burkholderia ambifaria (strain ATCC BAA-244 / DSM 16087 / CCUG 44356 / LMG 19182 / AMMD) TaxID=339670 RepID=Q0BAM5_BURCM|nr:DNA polymerase I [Burkholderia ambifaria]ABI88798.1 DNA polymerase I [Burkholderia ambifaria AMMD]AJY24236.1 DNA polymerase I [Burkholderia ambifaria AMMD]MBR7934971.1 DNA polymerase I [Burkholderia ambifaria]PEH69109.1 DNA polymerase I [Burkholderia ambifaria]QQC06298.1 DNA polymerase I [Burkholderia ambifaria]
MPEERNLEGKTLLLVDGSSYLYRAYHAMPDLRGPGGEPTGALYGIINMLRRMRKEVSAEYSACVFDAKGKTFRDDLYADYKANRPSMPPDLALQVEPIHGAVRALGWPLLMVEGVEADDVIGTLAREAERHGMNVIVSTGDKDLAQLVSDRVTLVNTMTNETLDRDGVIAKFGVPPERIIDYLALIGDTVDNVPGVEKCGPKTAVKWLSQYDSLDGVIEHAGEIKGVVGDNLRRALDFLPLGRTLVTVETACDLAPHLESIEASLKTDGEARHLLRDIFARYGFKTWLREVESAPAEGGGADAPEGDPAPVIAADIVREYDTIQTWAQFDAWFAKIDAAALTAFDTETTALDPMTARLVGLSFSIEPGKAAYLPVAHRGPDLPEQLPIDDVLARLRPWLESADRKKVGQHLKYDAQVLANYGIALNGIEHDTLLESYVLESHRTHDMDSLALRHLGVKTIKYEDVAGKGAKQIGFDEVALEQAAAYAAEDADITLQLHQALYPQVAREAGLERVYRDIEMPVSLVLRKMERTGVLIDDALLQAQSTEIATRLIELEGQAYELAGGEFNLGSPKQIGQIFFEKLQLPVVKKTPSGAPSTDEEVLQKLAEDYPLPKLLLEHRGLSKLKSTYTDKLPRMVNPATGRVHTNYAQAVAVTGRLASNDPNLQNIPVRTAEGRRIREAFIASPGHRIVSADYSQIELRIMAHISGDASLLRAFAQGEDIHRATAAEVFGVTPLEVNSDQRRIAKVINFGLIYGMSAFGLASNLGITRDAAKLYIDRYFTRYPGVAQYMEDTRTAAKDKGYVETVFGRRLWLPEINGGNGPRRQAAERAAINAPMQGTAADLIKLSMIAVDDWLTRDQLASRMIMQVHDELVLEVPDDELSLVREKLPEMMCGVAKLKVPLVAEVGAGANWEEAH